MSSFLHVSCRQLGFLEWMHECAMLFSSPFFMQRYCCNNVNVWKSKSIVLWCFLGVRFVLKSSRKSFMFLLFLQFQMFLLPWILWNWWQNQDIVLYDCISHLQMGFSQKAPTFCYLKVAMDFNFISSKTWLLPIMDWILLSADCFFCTQCRILDNGGSGFAWLVLQMALTFSIVS